MSRGEGFRPCGPEEPGAYADVDRWLYWREHGDDVLVGFDGVDTYEDQSTCD
jgi:hypothetical protein